MVVVVFSSANSGEAHSRTPATTHAREISFILQATVMNRAPRANRHAGPAENGAANRLLAAAARALRTALVLGAAPFGAAVLAAGRTLVAALVVAAALTGLGRRRRRIRRARAREAA